MSNTTSNKAKKNKTSSPKGGKRNIWMVLKSVEINPTITVSVMVILMILGAGAYAGYFAYTVGTKSLESVNEPESNPSKKIAAANNAQRLETGFTIISENEIILRNKKQMQGLETEALSSTVSDPPPGDTDDFISSPSSGDIKPDEGESIRNGSLPMDAEDQGIRLTVENIRKLDNALTMEVTLVNTTAQEVRFLYSFLDIRDEKGLSLSAIADGLPGQLPPDQKNYTGNIAIPLSLVNGVKALSLSLTDYPDQKINLQLDNIPIVPE